MSKYQPESINELILYTKRKLGEDISDTSGSWIEVDVAPDQYMDRMYEAIQKYQLEHYGGSARRVQLLRFVSGQQSYQLLENTQAVIGLSKCLDTNMFSLEYQTRQQLGLSFNQFDIVTASATFQYIDLINQMLSKKSDWEFDTVTKKITFLNTINNESESATGFDSRVVAVDSYLAIDIAESPKIFNEIWIKDYYTTLIKLQWAENLSKYSGMTLPGGIQINAPQMKTEALVEKERLEKLLQDMYRKPPKFFVG